MADNKNKDNNNEKLDRFGRYLILDNLFEGGMGKISRARYISEQADKIVAIKMIQPQFSQDPKFKKMFMDEIKVTFGLLHPNIAQTYDYGILNNQLYTAMEYVDGKNLKQFSDRLKDIKCLFPIEVSIYITSQVCQGLNYAHNFTDKLTGTPFNIVHRDISPHNIMITYDGAVKVIDFGIAKAEINSEETQAGMIKGKISYLAPEYLELDKDDKLDHRYDQFAVGITLWELLCARKLFQAGNELSILKKIQACKVPPPSSINKKVPPELDNIVMTSLAKDRNKRFKTMDHFNRALVKFLYSQYPDFNSSDLFGFSRQLFKEEIAKDKEKLKIFGKIDIAPYLKDLKDELEGRTESGATAVNKDDQKEDDIRGSRRQEIDLGFSEEASYKNIQSENGISLSLEGKKINPSVKSPPVKEQLSQVGTRPKNSAGSKIIERPPVKASGTSTGIRKASFQTKKIQIKAGTSGIINNIGQNSSENHTVQRKRLQIKNTSFPLGKSSKGILRFSILTLLLGGFFYKKNLILSMMTDSKEERIPSSEKRPEGILKQKNNSEFKNISQNRRIIISNTRIGQNYFINNKKVKISNFYLSFPLNKKSSLRVEEEGKFPMFYYIDVTEKEPAKIVLENSVPGLFGLLTSSEKYPPGTTLIFSIKGHEVIVPLPLKEMKIPIGEYKGTIKTLDVDIMKDVSFEIKEDQIFRMDF